VTATFVASLPAPVQTGPADGAVFYNNPRNLTLNWRAVTGAVQYDVEIECCNGSWSPWQEVKLTATFYGFTWDRDGQGRWRVTAIAPDGSRGTPSGWRTFTFDTQYIQRFAGTWQNINGSRQIQRAIVNTCGWCLLRSG